MKILVGSSGGAPSTNFVRSLKGHKLIGMTCNRFDIPRATIPTYLIPPAKDGSYIENVQRLINYHNPDFLHTQNDEEVIKISDNRDKLNVKVFLPRAETVSSCQDKYASNKIWEQRGIKVPKTFLLNTETELRNAFKSIKGKLWIRANKGAFGKGSLPTDNFDFAREWITFHEGWGEYTASECLSPNSVTFMSIWNDGELVVGQTRKRISWEHGNRTVSGVTGITGVGVTVDEPKVTEVALDSILAIDTRPNGLFGVDMTYDHSGFPQPTEINIGRFFTTILFFTKAGLNMPQIYLDTAFGKKVKIKNRINPLPTDLLWIRGMDIEPILTTKDKLWGC